MGDHAAGHGTDGRIAWEIGVVNNGVEFSVVFYSVITSAPPNTNIQARRLILLSAQVKADANGQGSAMREDGANPLFGNGQLEGCRRVF